jgi:hypothetical protein
MTFAELTAVFDANGIPGEQAPNDSTYVSPAREWFIGDFASGLQSWLSDAGVLNWQSESGDCDDFAAWGRAYGKICNGRMKVGASLAIGEFKFTKSEGGHACVVAVEQATQKLIFLDRVKESDGLTCVKEVFLTEAERLSCFFWYI